MRPVDVSFPALSPKAAAAAREAAKGAYTSPHASVDADANAKKAPSATVEAADETACEMDSGGATGGGAARCEVSLINYEMVKKLKGDLSAKPFDLIVCDEVSLSKKKQTNTRPHRMRRGQFRDSIRLF